RRIDANPRAGDKCQPQSAAAITGPIEVRERGCGSERCQAAIQRCSLPFHRARMRCAPHADALVTPWLPADPFEGRGAILSVVQIGLVLAFRSKPAPAILQNHYVPCAHE